MVHLPLVLSFWFVVAAYVVHVLDESLLGGSFVEKVRQHWWPEYSWRKFFWFTVLLLGVGVAGAYLPARRAAAIEPVEVLRSD